jgi:hypothetical protein
MAAGVGFGSSSGRAQTASSWSRASAGSMVISGRSRRSSRPAASRGAPRRRPRPAPRRGKRRDAVLVDRDQRHRLRRRRIAQPRDDPRRGRPSRAGPVCSASTSSPSFGAVGGAGGTAIPVRALVDGQDAPALGPCGRCPGSARIGADPADQPRLVVDVAAPHRRQPGKDPVARSPSAGSDLRAE